MKRRSSLAGKRKRHDDERRRCQGNESQIDAGVTSPATRTPRFLLPSTHLEACRCLRHAHYNRRFLVRRSWLDLRDLPHYDSHVKIFWREKCRFTAFYSFSIRWIYLGKLLLFPRISWGRIKFCRMLRKA